MMGPLNRLRSLFARPATDEVAGVEEAYPAQFAAEAPTAEGWHAEPAEYDDVEYTVTPWSRLKQIAFSGRAYDRTTAGGTLMSVVLHGVLFLLVAEIVVEGPVSNSIVELHAYMTREEPEIEQPEPLLTLAPVDELEHENPLASIAMSQASVLSVDPELPLEMLFEDHENPDIKLRDVEERKIEAAELTKVADRPGEIGEEVMHVDGAVDRITREIMDRLYEGPVLVVWMMDESISLVEERAAVAERLERVYGEIGGTQDRRRAGLLSAVIGYGQGANERVAPTTDYEKVIKAIGQVNPDTSGIENVFSTIIYSIEKYRPLLSAEKRQIVCVVWTDESGDDFLRVEEAVQLCQRFKVPVFTVGPSAMFGKQIGLHEYTDPEDGQKYNLPVFRGPDSAFQERINLDYWFDGPQLDTMHAGIGPFALTRLALESGGAYFINDAEADRSPFRLEAMKGLMPEYSSPQSYMQRVAQSPLRTAVRRAVEMSYQYELRGTPQLEFAPTGQTYQTELVEAQQTVAYNGSRIDQLLSVFGKGFEDQYEQEPSGRWRAWYDITYGRILAASVRNMEYNLACAEMKGKGSSFVDEMSNRWNFQPADKYRTTSTETMAAEARRLLSRVIENHPDTPFAALAERELRHPMGFNVEESYVAPPPPPMVQPANPNPTPPPPPPPPPPAMRREEQLRMLERKTPAQLPKI
jgi:hypothetical protein